MRILVTGASGFVGKALCALLLQREFDIIGVVRRLPLNPLPGLDYRILADLNRDTIWSEILDGVDVIVHCAARTHVIAETDPNPLMAYREINVDATVRLAEQASNSSAKRFIYISSIKVNGESTSNQPFKPNDTPAPENPYGISKWEAEQALQNIAKNNSLDVVIIRPPLVYGPGVLANFRRLMQLIMSYFPLPFGAIHNSRSLVALDNLVDLIAICLKHPAAANETFLVSDGDDLSTTALVQRMSVALGKKKYLIPVPKFILQSIASMLGKADYAKRLVGSLQVDISKTRDLLGWSPPVSMDDALKNTAKYFLTHPK